MAGPWSESTHDRHNRRECPPGGPCPHKERRALHNPVREARPGSTDPRENTRGGWSRREEPEARQDCVGPASQDEARAGEGTPFPQHRAAIVA